MAKLLHPHRHYSCRNASIGSSRAAFRAGKYPNTTPTAAENRNATSTIGALKTNGVFRMSANAIDAPNASTMPMTQTAVPARTSDAVKARPLRIFRLLTCRYCSELAVIWVFQFWFPEMAVVAPPTVGATATNEGISRSSASASSTLNSRQKCHDGRMRHNRHPAAACLAGRGRNGRLPHPAFQIRFADG